MAADVADPVRLMDGGGPLDGDECEGPVPWCAIPVDGYPLLERARDGEELEVPRHAEGFVHLYLFCRSCRHMHYRGIWIERDGDYYPLFLLGG